MKLVELILVIFLVNSCNSKKGKNKSSKIIDTSFSFRLLDQKGFDLLDPKNENTYNWSNIKIFSDAELINDISGEFKTSNEATLVEENPTGIFSIGIFSSYGLNINEVEGLDSVENTYYLQLSETDIDTLKVETTLKPFWVFSKFQYNNQIVFKTSVERGNVDGIIIKNK